VHTNVPDILPATVQEPIILLAQKRRADCLFDQSCFPTQNDQTCINSAQFGKLSSQFSEQLLSNPHEILFAVILTG
jgi:hypothetical protein